MSGKESEATVIPQIRQVFYDTYANLPAANTTRAGDLAYATDRRCLYRSTGAAWDVITIYSLADIAANIPAAATLPNGSIYWATDTEILYIKQGAAWLPMTPTSRTIVTGSYTGDNGDNRQITTGFKCSMVIILDSTDAGAKRALLIPGSVLKFFDASLFVGGTALHATDGFIVFNTADIMNTAPRVHDYWAISE